MRCFLSGLWRMQDNNPDLYFVPKGNGESLYKEKGSKFHGYLFTVRSESEVELRLSEVRALHSSARHHCYAYRLDPESGDYRANDDGEPSGSAGKPIYGQLLSSDLYECIIIVVRYFGGVKLGVGGLITAYKEAAHGAIENSGILSKTITRTILIRYLYEHTSDVNKWVHHKALQRGKETFETDCTLELEVPRVQFNDLVEEIDQLVFIERVKD